MPSPGYRVISYDREVVADGLSFADAVSMTRTMSALVTSHHFGHALFIQGWRADWTEELFVVAPDKEPRRLWTEGDEITDPTVRRLVDPQD